MEQVRKRRRFSTQERKELIDSCRRIGIKATSEKYGVNYLTLSSWRKRMPEMDLNACSDLYIEKLNKLEKNLEKKLAETKSQLVSIRQRKEVLKTCS